jgi:hypothetical protein
LVIIDENENSYKLMEVYINEDIWGVVMNSTHKTLSTSALNQFY